MRPSTIIFLLAAILFFTWFGLDAIGLVLGVGLAVFVALLLAIAVALWFVKRNMQRRLAELKQAVDQAHAEFARSRGREPSQAIDVELRAVKEGEGDSSTWATGKPAPPDGDSSNGASDGPASPGKDPAHGR